MATVSWISLHHELFMYVVSLQGRIVTTKFIIIYNFKRLKTKTIVFAKCRYCHCQKDISNPRGKNAENWHYLKSIVECCFGILEGFLLHGKHKATYYSLTKKTKKILPLSIFKFTNSNNFLILKFNSATWQHYI
jgi:hypothetical protein